MFWNLLSFHLLQSMFLVGPLLQGAHYYKFYNVNYFVITKTIHVKIEQFRFSHIKGRLIYKIAISLVNNFASVLFGFALRERLVK